MAPSVVLDPPTSDIIEAKSLSQTSNGIAQPKRKTIVAPLPNPSLQVTADHQLKQAEAPVHAPSRGEVLLHIKATGVCGYAKGFWKG